MKLAIILSQAEPETVFNALRLGNFALKEGDTVTVFLTGAGVELDQIRDEKFLVREQAEMLLKGGGRFMACTKCMQLREASESEVCPLSTMQDLYELVRTADRVVSF
jgi:uncharacterized protein involved in oxidation of intracellular sulfur